MGFMDQFKDFAGKVGSTIESGAKSISDSSKKMAEKSKLKSEISQLENEVNSAYISIGKVYFDRLCVNPEPECENAVKIINEKSEQIVQLRQQLDLLDDKVPCSQCGAAISRNQTFCDKCGAKVTANVETVTPEIMPVEEAPATEKVCPECGAPVEEGQTFCQECGKQL